MRILGIIPARYNSTRFPGKPLVEIKHKSMIQRVYEQALKAGCLSDVIVATDDERILNHVTQFGGKAVMTSAAHKSGTERCLEAYQEITADGSCFDIVINIQGDEPFINPDQIDKVAACFNKDDTQIASLAKIIRDKEELSNPNVVKLVIDNDYKALYFSRYPIPYNRDNKADDAITKNNYLKHVGIYAYRSEILQFICKLPPSKLELSESLEQLRWLENGYRISINLTDAENIAIDTPDDLAKAEFFLDSINK